MKLPNENLVAKIQTCMQVARKFFQCTVDEKEKWRLEETLKLDDRYHANLNSCMV